MNKFLKVFGIVAAAYLIADAGVIFGIGVTTDLYEGRINIDEDSEVDRLFAIGYTAANTIHRKIWG